MHPCVAALLRAFEELDPAERRRVVRQLRGVCAGYEDGLDATWEELLQVSRGESVLKDQAYEALAATMTELKILHHPGRFAKAIVPKGWS